MHHKKCKNGGFRAFSLKQNVVICVKNVNIVQHLDIHLIVITFPNHYFGQTNHHKTVNIPGHLTPIQCHFQ